MYLVFGTIYQLPYTNYRTLDYRKKVRLNSKSRSVGGIELSVVIPVFNEAGRLPATLNANANFLPEFVPHAEVIVVDDGSTDGTAGVVKALTQSYPLALTLVALDRNQGKGAAVRAGVAASHGAFILVMDADSATPITELPTLWARRNDAAVIVGSRYLPNSKIRRAQPLVRQLISRLGNFAIHLVMRLNLADTQNGFKLFRGELARAIFRVTTVNRWGFDIEVLTIAKRWGATILEVPVAWTDAAGSKLRAGRDAVRTLGELIRIRMNLSGGIYDRKRRMKNEE